MRLIFGLMVVLFCSVGSCGDWANGLDRWGQETFEWSNRDAADFISDVGVTSLVGGAFIASAMEEEHRWDRVAMTAGTLVGTKLLTSGLKRIFQRERPYPSEHSGYSFPSGHASESAAAAGIICLRSNQMCGVAILTAIGTGILRISAGAHNLTDVGVGLGLGFASGTYIPTLYKSF